MSRTLQTLASLCCISLSSSVYALQPLSDEQMSEVVGQAGLSINVQTRIQAGEIRYSQQNSDGSERGSISLKNVDLFGTGVLEGGNPLELLDAAVDEPSNRGFAQLGLSNSGIVGVAQLAAAFGGEDLRAIDSQGNLIDVLTVSPADVATNSLLLFDPELGEGLTSVTATVDVEGDALRVVLPRLTRIQRVLHNAVVDEETGTVTGGFVNISLISSTVAIPLGLEFDLAINDQTLGRILVTNFTDLDTELSLSGRNDGTSGVRIDLDLGVGFETVRFIDTDEGGGEFSLDGFRLGQVEERPSEDNRSRPGFGFRFALGAPLLGLTLDAEQRSLVDLTTGQARDATALVVGLPEIQNLDLTIDNIRVGNGNLGGLDILDINTLVGNDTVQQLNQTFGRNFALGNDAGVDALGQSAIGYQLKGELLLSGTADNSLQFNGQWGGQIGSIRYYDSRENDDLTSRVFLNNDQNIGFNDISIYAEDTDAQGNSILTPAQFEGTLTLTPQGVELGNLNARGSIAIQSVTIGQGNLGAFLIDNFQLRDSQITISGRP